MDRTGEVGCVRPDVEQVERSDLKIITPSKEIVSAKKAATSPVIRLWNFNIEKIPVDQSFRHSLELKELENRMLAAKEGSFALKEEKLRASESHSSMGYLDFDWHEQSAPALKVRKEAGVTNIVRQEKKGLDDSIEHLASITEGVQTSPSGTTCSPSPNFSSLSWKIYESKKMPDTAEKSREDFDDAVERNDIKSASTILASEFFSGPDIPAAVSDSIFLALDHNRRDILNMLNEKYPGQLAAFIHTLAEKKDADTSRVLFLKQYASFLKPAG